MSPSTRQPLPQLTYKWTERPFRILHLPLLVVTSLPPMSIPAVDSSDRLLQISSIPVVDLRLFSQSELASLSLCSDLSFDLRRSDDVVDPKIDRSIFNESAGSRKQTYSRLRLARRPSDASSAPGPRRRRPDLLPDDDASDRRNNDQIAFFLRKLFAAASGETIPETAAPRPPSERRKANSDGGIVVYDNGSEIVNRDGVVVDVTALGRREDPFVAELRRRTAGLLTKEDVVGFLEGLEGQWGSNRRKKKFVDAGELGDALPRGWKISISVKKRGGRAWLIIRKYIRLSLFPLFILYFSSYWKLTRRIVEICIYQ